MITWLREIKRLQAEPGSQVMQVSIYILWKIIPQNLTYVLSKKEFEGFAFVHCNRGCEHCGQERFLGKGSPDCSSEG